MSVPFNVSSLNNTPGRRQQVIGFIQNMFPQRIVSGIRILLNTCCEIVISNIALIDTGPDFTVKVTAQPLNFYESPVFLLYDNESVVSSNSTYLNGVVTFTGVTLGSGTSAISVSLLIPTSSDGNIGTFQNSNSITVVVP